MSTLITWLTDSHGLIRGVSTSMCGAMGGGGGGDEGIFGQMSSLELASPILSMNAPAMTEGAMRKSTGAVPRSICQASHRECPW